MRAYWLAVCSILFISTMGYRAVADGMVLGLSPDIDTLELYKTPTDEKAAHEVTSADLTLPTAILGQSNNGMFKIAFKGGEYWVISDDVKSDVSRQVDTSCDPKLGGAMVAHGKRGGAEQCQ